MQVQQNNVISAVDQIQNRHSVLMDSRVSFPDLFPGENMSSTAVQETETIKTSNNRKIEKNQSEQNESVGRMDIRIEIIEEKDADEVITFLKEFFFKDEPMNTYLVIGECKELEEYSLKSLPDKCSFKAVNSHGEIVGVAINGITKKPPPNEPFQSYAAECKHLKFRKILTLMEYIDHHFNLFDLYPDIDFYMDGKILAVNSNYRGFGIAGKLMERTIQYMRENKIPVIHVMCSSHYSARVCEKLNFKVVYQLPFVDYVVNGENPIRPAEPHNDVKIMVQEV